MNAPGHRRSKSPHIHITDATARRVEYSPVKTTFYLDTLLQGFVIRAQTTTKVYAARAFSKQLGKLIMVTLGNVNEMRADDARAKAKDLLQRIAEGEDPGGRKRSHNVALAGQAPGPKDPPRWRFSIPHIDKRHFRHLVDQYGGRDMAARSLKMSLELMDRYYAGASDPPFVVLLALWFTGPAGFDQAFSETHYSHQQNFLEKKEAQREVARLTATLDRVRLALEPGHPALALMAPELPQAPALALPGGAS